MKVFTIERCWDCPAYRPDSGAYYDEYGRCQRNEELRIQDANIGISEGCPLSEWMVIKKKIRMENKGGKGHEKNYEDV